MRLSLLLLPLAMAATPAAAQQKALGVYGLWGAFEGTGRCWAIAEPQGGPKGEGSKPFASVGYWPGRGVRGQLHIRLSRGKRPNSAVLLKIDDRTFQLAGGGADAWAPDPAADAEIVAALRTGIAMSVETRSTAGARVRDVYRLKGAATAIDAAAIGCARQ
jgi:hypothetical protein